MKQNKRSVLHRQNVEKWKSNGGLPVEKIHVDNCPQKALLKPRFFNRISTGQT
jgi:hypothetical protein